MSRRDEGEDLTLVTQVYKAQGLGTDVGGGQKKPKLCDVLFSTYLACYISIFVSTSIWD